MPPGELDSVQLIRLADELEVLLRAGLPLGSGLRDASRRWRGRLRSAAEQLALRIDSGVSVEEALRSSTDVPAAFRALAATGLSTDRPADIFEAYADSARQFLILRERLVRSLIYPAIVLIMAYGLTILLVSTVLPQIGQMISDLTSSPPWWVRLIEPARATLPLWSWAIPVAGLALYGLWRLVFRLRGVRIELWDLIPVVRRVLADLETATASRLLAALLECEVSLPLALSLAGQSLARPRIRAAVEAVAEDVQRGIPASRAFYERSGAPPLWRALFAHESGTSEVHAGLIHISEILAERARAQADLLGRMLPTVLLVGIGGVTVAIYAGAVFGPLIALWNRIGVPS